MFVHYVSKLTALRKELLQQNTTMSQSLGYTIKVGREKNLLQKVIFAERSVLLILVVNPTNEKVNENLNTVDV